MRASFLVFGLFAGLVGMIASSPAFAICNPVISDNLAVRVVCATHADKTCSQLGASTMDGDKQNIIACLATSTGSDCTANQCQWKVMNSEPSYVVTGPNSGYQKLNNGLILQWTTGAPHYDEGSEVIAFPIPFNNVFSVQIADYMANASLGDNIWWQISSIQNNSITAYAQGPDDAQQGNHVPMVFAIGN